MPEFKDSLKFKFWNTPTFWTVSDVKIRLFRKITQIRQDNSKNLDCWYMYYRKVFKTISRETNCVKWYSAQLSFLKIRWVFFKIDFLADVSNLLIFFRHNFPHIYCTSGVVTNICNINLIKLKNEEISDKLESAFSKLVLIP